MVSRGTGKNINLTVPGALDEYSHDMDLAHAKMFVKYTEVLAVCKSYCKEVLAFENPTAKKFLWF